MKTQSKEISSNNSIDFYTDPSNIKNQDLVKEIISYFENGEGSRRFTPLDFLNLLWKQNCFVLDGKNNPDETVSTLLNLPLDSEQLHILLGFILKLHGGYPVDFGLWIDDDLLKIMNQIERKFLNYNEDTAEKVFCKRSIESLIKYMKETYDRVYYWNNEKRGVFEFGGHPLNTRLFFRECTSKDYPIIWLDGNSDTDWAKNAESLIVAEGFIPYYLYNYEKVAEEIYSTYYQNLRQEYIDKENKAPDAYSRNLKEEFYSKHIKEETGRIKNSSKIFEFLTPKDKKNIDMYVKSYFMYIEQLNTASAPIIGQTENNNQTIPQPIEARKQVQTDKTTPKRTINAEKLKPYFTSAFKGAGNININYFDMLINKLTTDRTQKEFAQIAAMCYCGTKMSKEKPSTFSKWYVIFCECIGCKQKKYDSPRKLLYDIKDNLKTLFDFLQ